MKKCFLLLSVIMLAACADNTPKQRMTELFGKAEPVKMERFSLQYDSVRDPILMTFLKGNLIMENHNYTFHLTVFDMQTGRYKGDYLPQGNGPGEYLYLWDFSTLGGKLTLNDHNKQLQLFIDEHMQVEEEKVRYESPLEYPHAVCPISDDMYVCSGFIENGKRFAVFNRKGEVISTFGEYPDTEEANRLNLHDRAMIYQTHSVYDPARKELVVHMGAGEYLAIYDLSNVKRPKLKVEHSYAQPVFKTGERGTGHVPGKEIRGITDIAITSKYIVCLYSGDKLGWTWPKCRTVLLFSRTGKPVKRLELPQSYTCVATNEGRVYVLGNDEETGEYIIDSFKP